MGDWNQPRHLVLAVSSKIKVMCHSYVFIVFLIQCILSHLQHNIILAFCGNPLGIPLGKSHLLLDAVIVLPVWSIRAVVSWLTQSDQSDFSIGGVYFSYTPPRRCLFFAWGLDLLRIMGPWYKSAARKFHQSKTPILT